MRILLIVAIVAPLAADVIPEVRYKISAGDLTSADAIVDASCQSTAPTSECAAATSWLARGALILKQPDRATVYLHRTQQMTQELLKKVRVDDDPYLATAVGASIEVESRLLASQGKTDQAIALLRSELPKWKLWSIQARIQKNINILTLEGEPAPSTPVGSSGHPALLFLWGHWCSDCTDQGPIIEHIRQRYESQGLLVFAPTRRIGRTDANDHATPEQEDREIELVWKKSYPGLSGVSHAVDEPLMLSYGVTSTPTLVLIDPAGIVRMYCPYRMSESALASRVEQLLQPPPRRTPPTRDPSTPGYVKAKELPDGTNAPPTEDGNFILGPTHNPAPETATEPSALQGRVFTFNMESTASKIYPGIARDPHTSGTSDPNDPAKMVVTTSHPAPYTRRVSVYVPKQYVPGTAAPFIVGADGPDPALFAALDNLIAQHRVPAMIAISIGNGGGDAQGSERGLEYDTMSGLYAEFVETEVLPLVEQQGNVKLTKDPDLRATMGGSSGGSCALIMAWYHPELYHRVLTYSGTYVNQQWPSNPQTPHGAWEFHEHLIPNTPRKPLRIWMEVGDRDLLNPNVMRDNMHDWVVANENMARVLAAKGYHYQFVFVRNAGHTDRSVKLQTLPEALEYLWSQKSDSRHLSTTQ